MVDESIINIIKKYINELNENGLYFHKVILYGSYAKGTADEDSDIDLMLVSNQFEVDNAEYLPLIWLSATRTNYRIEPYLIGEKRFYTGFSPLIDAAKYEGVEISLN